jgi:hypothetical protein
VVLTSLNLNIKVHPKLDKHAQGAISKLFFGLVQNLYAFCFNFYSFLSERHSKGTWGSTRCYKVIIYMGSAS